MLDTSDSPKRAASLLKLAPDFAVFIPCLLGLSALRLPLSTFTLTSSVLPFLLCPLPDLRGSGSSTLSGGLGGARDGPPAGVDFGRFSLSNSVASGVTGSVLDLPKSSLLPTASRLCALLKVGYELLLDLAAASPLLERRSISGTTMDTFLGVAASRSRSLLPDLRECSGSLVEEEDLWEDRVLSRGIEVGSSLSWCFLRLLFSDESVEEGGMSALTAAAPH